MIIGGLVKQIITMVTAAEMLQESLFLLLFVVFCADMKPCGLIAEMAARACR